MTSDHPTSTEFLLPLSEEERTQLLTWLEARLQSTLIEEHRTESSAYRKHVQHQEEILENLIQKLREP